jgi:DNA-directed RNA polymerase specialized sigma subunit
MREIKVKSPTIRLIERVYKEPIERTLHRLYIIEEKPLREIANEIGVSHDSVKRWLSEMRIERRLPHHKILKVKEELVEIEGM